jgi:predicted transcriptional regulator
VKAAQPTLVELIRRHLAEQQEPRSAAEISTALGQAHPARDIAPKVVRVTLEGLVAKSQAKRSKQGRSVFYAAPASEPTVASGTEAQPEDADC